MDVVIFYLQCCAAAAYIVRVLLFDGTTGPFESSSKIVVDNGTHEGLVDLWDRVRAVFGVYRIEDGGNGLTYWHTTSRTDLWRCPKCLSFWCSFLTSVPFIILTHQPYYTAPFVHLSIVFVVQFVVFLQLCVEGDD